MQNDTNDRTEWAVLFKCLASGLTPERIAAEWNRQAIINHQVNITE